MSLIPTVTGRQECNLVQVILFMLSRFISSAELAAGMAGLGEDLAQEEVNIIRATTGS